LKLGQTLVLKKLDFELVERLLDFVLELKKLGWLLVRKLVSSLLDFELELKKLGFLLVENW
jgi:hypothetical protein